MTKPSAGTAHIDGPYCFIGCPRELGRACAAQILGPDAEWKNIGTPEAPTLNQSFNCVKGCGWHGYVVDGKLIDAPRKEPPSAAITTLHVCAACEHPELFTAVLTPTEKGLQLKFESTAVRDVVRAGAVLVVPQSPESR